MAWRGEASYGTDWEGRRGMEWMRSARNGPEIFGRHGVLRKGMERQGTARQARRGRIVTARIGAAWNGKARQARIINNGDNNGTRSGKRSTH
jgi:hypothetical protein